MSQSVEEELQPVLLELGKALFVCQAFEGTLVMLLSTVSHEEADQQDGAFSESVDLFSQRTLGQLLKRLRDKVEIPEELDAYFIKGLKCRNWIVHEFLHKCVDSLHIPKGRVQVIELLVEYKTDVKLADVVANKLLDLYLEKYGLSVDSLKANADRLWDYMNPDIDRSSMQ